MKDLERKKILELLSNGHIDAQMAESLLKALGQKENIVPQVRENSFKQIKIYINDKSSEKINVSIPLEFARLLLKNGVSNNNNVSDNLSSHDIDIEKIIEMANSGAIGELINIQTDDGTTIIIKVE